MTLVRCAVIVVVSCMSGGCVHFASDPKASKEWEREVAAPLGKRELDQRLAVGAAGNDVRLRLTVGPEPEFGIAIFADGLVRFVGGYGVACHGVIMRRINAKLIAELIDELVALDLRNLARSEDDPGPTDVPVARLELPNDTRLSSVKFYLELDHPNFARALEMIHDVAGTREPAKALPQTGERPRSQDCSDKTFWR